MLQHKYSDDVINRAKKLIRDHDIKSKSLKSLSQVLGGKSGEGAVWPWSESYNTARINFNRGGTFQFFPLLICFCSSSTDVKYVLNWLQQNNLLTSTIPLSIRAGAHDWTNQSLCNGVVIDVSRMKQIKFSSNKSELTVGAGMTTGMVQLALAKNNLQAVLGTGINTGVCGVVLGGGIGLTTRKYGLACDQLIRAQVVIPCRNSGKYELAEAVEGTDLLWACKGGGGSVTSLLTTPSSTECSNTTTEENDSSSSSSSNLFRPRLEGGVVVSLTLQVHPAPSSVIVWSISYSIEDIEKVMNRFLKVAANANDGVDPDIGFSLDLYSPKQYEACVKISGQWPNTSEEQVKKWIRDTWPKHEMELIVKRKTHLEALSWSAEGINPKLASHFRSAFADKDQVLSCRNNSRFLELIKDYMTEAEPSESFWLVAISGPGFHSVSPRESAFFWRDSVVWFALRTSNDDPALFVDRQPWVNTFYSKLLKYMGTATAGGEEIPRSYINFKNPDLIKHLSGDQVEASYWGKNAKRLREISCV